LKLILLRCFYNTQRFLDSLLQTITFVDIKGKEIQEEF
jgi:hypothetical protein